MNRNPVRTLCAAGVIALVAVLALGAPLPAPQVKGLKEKVHFPLYDAVTIQRGAPVSDSLGNGIWRFFVDSQRKSSLETNMEAIGPSGGFRSMEITGLRVAVAGGEGVNPDGTPDTSGAGNAALLDGVLHGSVLRLIVGEKIMIQHPTYLFPAGGGVYTARGEVASNGEPSTAATFRFAEPVLVEKQQNFRVEIEFPDRDLVQQDLSTVFGPARIWVTLDGFLTRTVQ